MIARNDPCWCGSGKKWKKCHHPFLPPQDFQRIKEEYFKKYQIVLKTPEQIEGIRAAGKLAATILKKVCAKAKEGVTTQELDDYAMQLHKEAGATPAPLGYGHPPFPKGICTSLNEVICHGIPNEKPLVNGDIMNIDVTSILNGYYGDCSAMVTIGEVSEEKQKVVDVSYECLMRAIKILKPGVLVSEIGKVIEDYATSEGCSVVNQFVAHGVGVDFHEAPQIPHNYNNLDIPLAAGMTFTIEPMINAGVREGKIDPNDHWTAYTLDGKPSAQWEHTLLITDDGYEILTLP
ncbi:MAG: methionyl aminopeptidase [Chlamydiales bacterium]|nr:methionyl aminopeptidase [Chlamydiia bacterium]MCP5503570.1 methionyl aminopeptidase [Chlamydiales bacterium]